MTRPRSAGIPVWAIASALAAPALLFVGMFIAQTLQPRTYDAIHDTISGLASLRAHDRWVMTSAMAAIGISYLVTAVGLRPVRKAARCILALGGVTTLCVAAFPQPLRGGSIMHEAATAATLLALAAWPLYAMSGGGDIPLLRRERTLLAEAIIIGLTLWLVVDLHAPLLGIAERAAAGAEALLPLAVVVSAWRALSLRSSGGELDCGVEPQPSAAMGTPADDDRCADQVLA